MRLILAATILGTVLSTATAEPPKAADSPAASQNAERAIHKYRREQTIDNFQLKPEHVHAIATSAHNIAVAVRPYCPSAYSKVDYPGPEKAAEPQWISGEYLIGSDEYPVLTQFRIATVGANTVIQYQMTLFDEVLTDAEIDESFESFKGANIEKPMKELAERSERQRKLDHPKTSSEYRTRKARMDGEPIKGMSFKELTDAFGAPVQEHTEAGKKVYHFRRGTATLAVTVNDKDMVEGFVTK